MQQVTLQIPATGGNGTLAQMTSAFLPALVESHNIATRVEVWSGGALQLVLQPLGRDYNPPSGSVPASPGAEQSIQSAKVTVDKHNAVRRQCSFSVVDRDGSLTPTGASSLLTPFGNEVRLYRGVTYNDGSQELVPLGVFPISTVTCQDSGSDYTIQVDGYDRSWRVGRYKFTDTYNIASGTNYVTAIEALITRALSSTTFSATPTALTTPAITYNAGDDPWQRATELATAIGYEVFFDVLGQCVIQPQPDPTTAPVATTFTEGKQNTLAKLERILTAEDSPNEIIRDGTGSGVTTPVRAIAEDTNPASPTYLNGPYGVVVDYATDSNITSLGQASAAANAGLTLSLALLEQANLFVIPNPALDVNDVVQVTRARAGVTGWYYVIDSLDIPLSPDEIVQLGCRKVNR